MPELDFKPDHALLGNNDKVAEDLLGFALKALKSERKLVKARAELPLLLLMVSTLSSSFLIFFDFFDDLQGLYNVDLLLK